MPYPYSQEEYDRWRQDTLEYANKLRQEFGHPLIAELPPADLSDPLAPWTCRCPLAMALSELQASVGPMTITLFRDKPFAESRVMPLPVEHFVRGVDTGNYPDLFDPEPCEIENGLE